MAEIFWSVTRAVEEANKLGIDVSRPTIVKWIKKYGIGTQFGDKGSKLYVCPIKFKRLIYAWKEDKNDTEIEEVIRTNAKSI